ncbi:putative short-chain dehydrogenase [Daldinia sp. FL1419]|nr:putative short-chain dehydrogenase [Daldinia sp. FL1419]
MDAKGTVLVTGANGGLGCAIASQLASQAEFSSCYGLYTVRDANLAPSLRSVLSENPSHAHGVISLDLTNLDSVHEVARTINTRVAEGTIPPIQALILNAGFQDFGKQLWTDDGFDVTFSANYLGHWLLTMLLLGSMNKDSGRIVVIGSQSHDPYDKRNRFTGAFGEEKYRTVVHDAASFGEIAKGTWCSAKEDPSWRSGYRRYGAAKLFSIMMIYELQRRVDRDPVLKNISVIGVDPGTLLATSLQRDASWVIRILIFRIIYPITAFLFPNGLVRSTRKSASQILEASLGREPKFPKGLYYFDGRQLETSTESKDLRKQDIVWQESIKYTHLERGETILTNLQ